MTNYLITGHAGFIGFHLSRALLKTGHSVVGIDAMTDYYDPKLKRDRLGHLEQFDKFTHFEGDITRPEDVTKVLRIASPGVLVHLAAQAGVRYSIENPELYVSANVSGTQVLLEAAKTAGVAHTMIASTSSVYGANDSIPFAENDRTGTPVSLYAATKIASEAIAHSYSSIYQNPTTCFRFFTVYGPWGRPDMALYKFVDAIDRGDEIDVYGYGNMRRDFTYIDDLVNVISALSEKPPVKGSPVHPQDTLSPTAPFRIVNAGNGSPTGLMDFILAVEEAVGQVARKRMLPMQPGDVTQTFSDTTLLDALIGARENVPVADGVRNFVEWHRQYFSNRRNEERNLE